MWLLKSKKNNGATKSFKVDGDTITKGSSYAAGSTFDAARWREPLDGVQSIANVLTTMADEPDWFIIRGESVADGHDYVQGVNRRYKRHGGVDPHWVECDRQWIMIDIDGLSLPHWAPRHPDEADRADIVRAITLELPECFDDVTCVAQWSSSAGLISLGDGEYEPGWDSVSVHLWYWLDRPVCCRSLRGWLRGYPSVDVAPYNPIQPHYIASPVIDGDDWWDGSRVQVVEGSSDTVTLPQQVRTLEGHEREAMRRRRIEEVTRSPSRNRHGYGRRAIASAVRAVTAARDGERNTILNRESYGMGQLIAEGLVDEEEAFRRLSNAAVDAGLPGDEAARTCANAIDQGRLNPRGAPCDDVESEPAVKTASVKVDPAKFAMRPLNPVKKKEVRKVDLQNLPIPSNIVEIVSGWPGNMKNEFQRRLDEYATNGHPLGAILCRADAAVVAYHDTREWSVGQYIEVTDDAI